MTLYWDSVGIILYCNEGPYHEIWDAMNHKITIILMLVKGTHMKWLIILHSGRPPSFFLGYLLNSSSFPCPLTSHLMTLWYTLLVGITLIPVAPDICGWPNSDKQILTDGCPWTSFPILLQTPISSSRYVHNSTIIVDLTTWRSLHTEPAAQPQRLVKL